MVVTQTANQPIKFTGQIVAYAAGVADTSISSTIQSTDNTPLKFTQAKRAYTTVGGNPSPYVPA